VGANLFFYGHKLKWQTGLQYATLDDSADDGGEYTGWGITTGLRMYW
jgi:phosphate-selective porin OprO/OprP